MLSRPAPAVRGETWRIEPCLTSGSSSVNLTAVGAGRRAAVPGEDAERIFALVAAHRRPREVRRAHQVLRLMLGDH